MKVLFIGGTGNISTACAALAVERGVELTVLTRGQRPAAPPVGARVVRADITDPSGVSRALGDATFDAVVNWIAYEPGDIERDVALWRSRTGQYVFISSAAAYQKPPLQLPITEATPLANPFWEYARKKIACEERLMRAHHDEALPVTVVRPSLTYGDTWIPTAVGGHGYTVVDRLRTGRPVIVHGDGQSLWTMTHSSDFARGLVGLLGNRRALGEAYHITSDEALTWDRIYATIAAEAGAEPRFVHIPSDFINACAPNLGPSLIGDKAFSAVFDNAKIRAAVPDYRADVTFAEGIRRAMAWFDVDPSRRTVDAAMNVTIDRVIDQYLRAWPGDATRDR